MQESPDGLSVYERIGTDDVPHCCCGECKCCNARNALMIAILHLAKLFPYNPPTCLAVRMAEVLLSPGKKDTSTLVGYFRADFGEETTEMILLAAAEFRKCETAEEVSKVTENFPVTAIA